MKKTYWVIASIIISAIADGSIAYQNRFGGHLDFNWFRSIVLLSFCIAVALIHYHRSRTTPSYFRSLFIGIASDTKRQYSFDYLRITAVVLVVCVHTFDFAAAFFPRYSPGWYAFTIAASICLVCNLIYIMISGALLLGGKDSSLAEFYEKRFLKVVVPLFAYYLFYAAIHGGLQNLYPAQLPELFRQMLAGAPDGAPHFWLIYVIISLYITAPFFKIMVNHMSDRMLGFLVLLMILLQAAQTYLPLFHLSIGIQTMLTSWESIFIIGYFFTRPASRQFHKPIFLLAIISLVLTVFSIIYSTDYQSLLSNTAPTMIMMSSGVFLFFYRFKERLRPPKFILSVVNHYSYSMILIHWYILYYVVGSRMGNHILSCFGIGGSIITILGTLLFSFLFAWIYDNTVVLLIQTVLHHTLRLLKGLR